MRIAKLIAYHVRIPLKRTIRHASHSRNQNETLLVCCRLEDGTEGWGEGLPREYVTGETIDSTLEHVRTADFSVLAGSITDLRDAVQRCDRFELPGLSNVTGSPRRECFGNAARCAIELSVLDACTQAEGVPLSAVTGLLSEALPLRSRQPEVRYSVVLTSMAPWREWVRAWKVKVYGFKQGKVKVGMPGRDDRATLARYRWMLGRNFGLRLDANEAWTCDTLEGRLAPLLPFGVESIEQPVPHSAVDGLTALRRNLPTPIMLDESLCSLEDSHRAIERGLCDQFNVRLSKCGGFIRSLQITALARAHGLGAQLGCQVGETGILSAAGRHFACSVGGLTALEGSYDRFLVREPLTNEDVSFRRGGRGRELTGPGLGISIDRRALQRVRVSEEHFSL